jgi:predicted MFS family arabinose efflux permease
VKDEWNPVMRLENMSGVGESKKEPAQTINNLGILSLILSRGITNLPSLVVSLLLVDIATSFNVQVGVAGQIRTTSGILSIIFAILMGVLSMRYSHKWLLAWGLILYIVSAVTSYFSTSLLVLMVFFALSGVATSMVTPMINTLIGRLVPPGKRVDVMVGPSLGCPSFTSQGRCQPDSSPHGAGGQQWSWLWSP